MAASRYFASRLKQSCALSEKNAAYEMPFSVDPNAIESDFRSFKMVAGGHLVKII